MSLKHWIIGGLLGLAGVASASATTARGDTQGASATAHGGHRVANDVADPAASGDLGHGDSAAGVSNTSSDDDSSDDVLGGSSSRPASQSRRLGWQSLLPGSIQ